VLLEQEDVRPCEIDSAMLVFLFDSEIVLDDFGETLLAERVAKASILLSQNFTYNEDT
jgi:hypothetical protein